MYQEGCCVVVLDLLMGVVALSSSVSPLHVKSSPSSLLTSHTKQIIKHQPDNIKQTLNINFNNSYNKMNKTEFHKSVWFDVGGVMFKTQLSTIEGSATLDMLYRRRNSIY